jgi:hypothetical protein
MLVHPPTQDDE